MIVLVFLSHSKNSGNRQVKELCKRFFHFKLNQVSKDVLKLWLQI